MITLTPRIGVSAVSSPLEVGADRAPAAVDQLAGLLRDNGCEIISLPPIVNPAAAAQAGRMCAESHVHAVAIASASWFEDYLILDFLEECQRPLLMWSLPGMETGALCGTQQLTWYLRQLGHPFHCVYSDLPSAGPALVDPAMTFLRAAALHHRLRRARIGQAGSHVSGMTESAVNHVALKRTLGPRIVPLDLPRLLARCREIPVANAQPLWQDVKRRAATCAIADQPGLDAIRFYLAVKELIQLHCLDALTVGCYPGLMGVPCLAASLLADEGIPLGCEGDANASIAQLILTILSRQPTHNTDWLEPLPEDGSVVLTHCGSGSFQLAEKQADIALQSVRLMGQGACAVFPAKPGPVTLVNLAPRADGYQCAVLEGQALSTTLVFPGNPLRVRFATPIAQVLDWIHAEGVGHHWAAAYGHHARAVADLAGIVGTGLRLVRV